MKTPLVNFTKVPSVERNRAKQKQRPPGSSRRTGSSTVLTPGSLLRCCRNSARAKQWRLPSPLCAKPLHISATFNPWEIFPMERWILPSPTSCSEVHPFPCFPQLNLSMGLWASWPKKMNSKCQVYLFFWPCGMWNLNSRPGIHSHPLCRKHGTLTTEPLDKSLKLSALLLGFCSLLFCFRWPFVGRTLHQSYFLRVPILWNQLGPSKHVNFLSLLWAPAFGPANTMRQANTKAFPDWGREIYKERKTRSFFVKILLSRYSNQTQIRISIQAGNLFYLEPEMINQASELWVLRSHCYGPHFMNRATFNEATVLINFWKQLRNKIKEMGTSLAVQWLRLHLSMQEVWVWSLIGELRSYMPLQPKKRNIKQKQYC